MVTLEQREALDAEFAAFVADRSGCLVQLAEMLTGDPDQAADLVQSALERTYPRWRRTQEQDLADCVQRGIVDAHRSWWRLPRHRELPVDEFPDRTGLGDLADAQAQRALVGEALAKLTQRERSVLVLKFYADLSEASTAAELGISQGTVKSTVHRALAKLRTMAELADFLPGQGMGQGMLSVPN
jgi:RNA polymerase sigma-70 factor (sigma-E family)